jgi:cytochrome d ubiquinol oxidase subunit II
VESPRWKFLWDWSFGLGSLVAAVLFGVAVGNILRGIPIDESGTFAGSFLGLLNPYSILIGLLSLSMMVMHGALYMTIKTDGELRDRMNRWTTGAWIATVVLYFLSTMATIFSASYLFVDILSNPLFWILFLILLAAIVYIPVAARAGRYFRSFLASATTIICMIGLAAVAMFPRLVPSSINLDYSLTIYNASSTPRTLTVMLIIALIGMPLVIAYSIYIYRVFMGKTVITEESY